MLFPSEPSGGTWIGLNDAGLTLALINWYAIPRRSGIGHVSRGTLIPTLLSARCSKELRAALQALPKIAIAPFRLIALALREDIVREFRWDQDNLEELSHAWAPRHWFSSGADEPRAQFERGRVATAAWRQPRAGRLPWLRSLHGSHSPARGPFCFCMHRRDAVTVSFTEIAMTQRTATMRYHDGPLCRSPYPLTTHQISLVPECKESAAVPTNEETGTRHEKHQSSLQSTRRSLLPGGLSPGGDLRLLAR